MNKIKEFILKHKLNILILFIEALAIGLIVLADLLTKHYIYTPIKNGSGDTVLIKGFLSFTWADNTGAAWGIFKDRAYILGIFSLITLIITYGILIFTLKYKSFLFRSSLVLIVAGGLGNVVDRFHLGFVRDFIRFDFITFPIFNLADSALTIGTIMLLVWVIFFYKPKEKEKNA
ncbi:MAG: signal peptidase II [Firmicutes bacterium]|nr:signal peptidase II [Bacillota bacterium]